jgi:hypothetical protein
VNIPGNIGVEVTSLPAFKVIDGVDCKGFGPVLVDTQPSARIMKKRINPIR